MNSKEYKLPNGKTAVFEYDGCGIGKITLECMDMLMGQLIAYKQCVQSRSFWDAKHCDGCMFYDDCPFDPREDEDEPQTETEIAKAIVHKMIDDAVIAEDAYPDLRQKMHDAVDEYERQTDCAWR